MGKKINVVSSVISLVVEKVKNVFSSVFHNTFSDFPIVTSNRVYQSPLQEIQSEIERLESKLKFLKPIESRLSITDKIQSEKLQVKFFIESNLKNGFKISEMDAYRMLGIQTKQSLKTVKIDSVSNGNGNGIDYSLIWTTMSENKCSFKQLPLEIRNMFNTESRNKYSSYYPYFNTLLSNGNVGKGYIAEVIKTFGVQWLEGKTVKDFPELPNCEKVSDGTIGQFLKIYRAYKEYVS